MQQIDIIGIDPGSLRTGWGIVREKSGVLELVDCGIIRTKPHEESFSGRLSRIYCELCSVIGQYNPEACAIEQVFTAHNAQSALKLGQARGAAVAACAAFRLEIFDYEPTAIKKSITGTGRAEKEQIAYMISRLLNISTKDMALDTTDALAAAVCHLSQRRFKKLTMQYTELSA